MTNDKGELDLVEMFKKIQADPEAKRVFLAMPRQERELAILGVQAYLGNELAKTNQGLDDLTKEVQKNERSAIAYRQKREAKENGGDDLPEDATMTQKIITATKKRFDQIMLIAMMLYMIWNQKP